VKRLLASLVVALVLAPAAAANSPGPVVDSTTDTFHSFESLSPSKLLDPKWFAAGGCWTAHWSDSHSYSIWYRAVHQQVSWCGNGAVITRWSVAEWPQGADGGVCYPAWGPESHRRAGGVGAQWVEVVTIGGWLCFSLPPPSPLFYDTVEVDVRYYAGGRREDV
jgi:hypothetical protein